MKTYKVSDGVTFTRESVERAFYTHQKAGLIKEWHRVRDENIDRGSRDNPIYKIRLTNGDMLGLANMWEAHAFVVGIATTRQAFQRNNPTIPDPREI